MRNSAYEWITYSTHSAIYNTGDIKKSPACSIAYLSWNMLFNKGIKKIHTYVIHTYIIHTYSMNTCT